MKNQIPRNPKVCSRIGSCISLILLMVCLTLAGCAAQNAYRHGKEMIATGRLEEGLEKLKNASELDQTNVEFRSSYLRAREVILQTYLQQADDLLAKEQYPDAKRRYRDALRLEPNHQAAVARIAKVDMVLRQREELKEVELALAHDNRPGAASKLKTILAENSDNLTAVSLLRQVAENSPVPVGESMLAASYQKPITIEFRDASLKQIFEVISRTSGLNFLFDKDVKSEQMTSIFLKGSTVESAIYLILLTNHLEQRVLDSNTILIFPNSPSKLLEYQEMVIKTFFLTNSDAKTVANTLKTILKAKDVVVDEKLNMLIMRDSLGAVRMAEKLIALQDIAEPEVMLEVEILEVKRLRLQELGIKWPESLTLTALSPVDSLLTLRDLKSGLNSASIGAAISPVVLNANVQDSDANILANPRIRARNHEKAKILIGERVPNVTTTLSSTGFVSESINYVEVGLKLDVEPTVYLDNDVSIKIALEVSSVVGQTLTKAGSLAYQIGTRTASTVLRLRDGQTQILAGLINAEERSNGNKVPGIGELPIVGRLFGSTSDNSQKTEIVLSITPRLIRNIKRPEARLSEFFSGTDGSFRVRPDGQGRQQPVSTSGATGGASRPSASGAAPSSTGPTMLAGPVPGNQAAPGPVRVAAKHEVPGASPGAGAAGLLSLIGPSRVKKGDTFVVDLSIQAGQPLLGLPVTLSFDPKIVRVIKINEGDFLGQGGAQTDVNSTVNPTGQIVVNGVRLSASGASGAGVLASVSFLALASSERAELKVVGLSPRAEDGRAVSMTLLKPYSFEVE